MTDQPRLSSALEEAVGRALEAVMAYGDGNQTAILLNAVRDAIPAAKALEAREELLTAALEDIVEAQYGGEYVPATGETAAERAKRALAEPQEAQ